MGGGPVFQVPHSHYHSSMCVIGSMFVQVCEILSWVWLSTASTRRSLENEFLGDQTVASVKLANKISCRFAMLCLVAMAIGCTWCVT